MLERLLNKNVLATGILRLRHVKGSKDGMRFSPVLLYRRTSVECRPDSMIEVAAEGRLEIGRPWGSKIPLESYLMLDKGSRLRIDGEFRFYTGCTIYVNDGATLSLGSGYVNSRSHISCFERISIGNGVAISEGVTIRDSDNHSILNSPNPKTKPIFIGDRVWIGMNVTILKGVHIGNGAVVAAGAVVTRDVPERSLVGGVPARVLREGVDWQ